jgi:Tetratricopeptide repeat
MFLDLGRYHEARDSVEQAVAILSTRRAGGEVASLRHSAFSEAGHVSILLANLQRAQALFTRSLRVAEDHALGPVAKARSLNGLGMVAKYTGRFEESDRHYRGALGELSSGGASDEALVSTLCHNLGGLEFTRKRYAAAERWARRGLSLRSRRPESFAAGVARATDLAALAAIVHVRGRYAEAAGLYRRSLASLRRRLGPRHFEVVFNLSQMAALEHARGRYPQSLRLYRASVPALRSLLGQDHPVVAQVAANLAKLRAHLGWLAGTKFQKDFRGI